MKASTFINEIESYYSEYKPATVKGYVYKFIVTRTEREIDFIFEYILDSFTNTYGKPPDIAIIRKAIDSNETRLKEIADSIWETAEGEVFKGRLRIGHIDSGRFIPNISALSNKGTREYIEHFESYTKPEDFIALLPEATALVKGER